MEETRGEFLRKGMMMTRKTSQCDADSKIKDIAKEKSHLIRAANLICLIAAGSTTGFTIGILTGMSSAPVASIIIASLLSIVPVISLIKYGLIITEINQNYTSHLSFAAAIILITFMLFLLAGLGTGIYVKKQNWFFGNPYKIEISDLKDAGFDSDLALDILKQRLIKSNIVPVRPGPLFANRGPGGILCQNKPSERSSDHQDVLPLFEQHDIVTEKTTQKVLESIVNIRPSLPESTKNVLAMAILEALWETICK